MFPCFWRLDLSYRVTSGFPNHIEVMEVDATSSVSKGQLQTKVKKMIMDPKDKSKRRVIGQKVPRKFKVDEFTSVI